jgi:hypothetical protein
MHNSPTLNRKLYAIDQPIESFFKSAEVGVYWKTTTGHYLGCNDYSVESAGKNLTFADILNKTDYDLPNHEKAAFNFKKNDLFVVTNNSTNLFIETTKLQSRISRSCLSFKTPLKNLSNHIVGLLGISFVLSDSFKLDVALIKPFLQNCNSYNLVQSYPALVLLLENNITKREAETLYYFIRYKTIKDITTQIKGFSPRTVEYRLNNCKIKLGAHTINEMLVILWDKNFAYLKLDDIYNLFL